MASIKIACTVFVFFSLGLVACQDDGVAVAEGPKQVSLGDLFGALGPEEDHEELQGQLDEMTGLLDSIGISAPISSQETDCVEEVEKNTDYNGGDLFEYSDDAHEVVVANSNNKMADSEEECRDICKAAAACNYWTFVKNWAVKCLLKTYILYKETKKGIVSGNVCRGKPGINSQTNEGGSRGSLDTLLHTDSKYKYYKVPVQLGLWLTSATVMNTCAIHSMKPQCYYTGYNDDNCVLSPSTDPSSEMAKILCNGNGFMFVSRCKHLVNIFWYMPDSWMQGSAWGEDASNNNVYGKDVMSTSGAQLYTICVRPI